MGTVVRPRLPSGRITSCHTTPLEKKTDFHLSKYVGKPCAQRPSTFAQFNFWTIVGVMSFESWMKSQHAAQRRSTNKQIVNYRSKSASCALSTLRLSQNSIVERLLGSCLLRAEHWPSVLITHLQKSDCGHWVRYRSGNKIVRIQL